MIGAYLKDTVTIVRHGTRDQYGTEGPTTSALVKCFIEWKTRLLRNIKGEEVQSSAAILMRYDPTLTHEDRVMVSGVEHPIVSIELQRDFAIRSMKVYIQ